MWDWSRSSTFVFGGNTNKMKNRQDVCYDLSSRENAWESIAVLHKVVVCWAKDELREERSGISDFMGNCR